MDENTPTVFPATVQYISQNIMMNLHLILTCRIQHIWRFIYTFLDDSLSDLIVQETNRYAFHYIANETLAYKSRVKEWQPTDVPDMKKYMGILIAMGIVYCPQVNLYWS